MSDRSIGERAYGQRGHTKRPWYVTAILGRVKPEDETIILHRPGHPADGMRVGADEVDDLGYEDYLRMAPPVPRDNQEG